LRDDACGLTSSTVAERGADASPTTGTVPSGDTASTNHSTEGDRTRSGGMVAAQYSVPTFVIGWET
jgi:hypothetical protein